MNTSNNSFSKLYFNLAVSRNYRGRTRQRDDFGERAQSPFFPRSNSLFGTRTVIKRTRSRKERRRSRTGSLCVIKKPASIRGPERCMSLTAFLPARESVRGEGCGAALTTGTSLTKTRPPDGIYRPSGAFEVPVRLICLR
ncbi:hypothetical protein GWI33_009245 [Rhynchophorus ferrugineus]|uniref:Uncharacterized protein n=1 Tax=Rhynchophorus ferrugineus TaxID=354439 RepID=A0A834MGR5_RHYFE|nr:hypothetical protein GWI33_009245 [Rhynchophorus ferrugineus]